MRFTREFYISKADQILVQQDDLIVYGQQIESTFYAKGFGGKRSKPDWHYRFRTIEQRDKHIAQWISGQQATKAYRAESKAKRGAAPRGLEVGDILYSSWGYDQTNIDYYQVTALIGEHMVEIRQIGCQSEETAWAQGNSVPAPDRFTGKPMRKIAKNGYVRITSFCGASKMEPVAVVAGAKVYGAQRWSAYA